MLVQDWLKQATELLNANNISSARLDTLILFETVLDKDRAWLLSHPEFEISDSQVAKLQKLLTRRAAHEPIAYIRGKTEFYGREFKVSVATLEPRPESETMIDLLKTLDLSDLQASNAPKAVYIADIGAGSGALGITALLELPNTSVDLLEINQDAIEVAKTNVDLFTLNISTIQSDLLANSVQDYDILLCNLPYVPDDHTINRAAMHEPRIAIFGGPDGLDLYRKLYEQITNLSKRPLYILTESLPPQHIALEAIAAEHGYKLLKSEDFIQVFKR